MKAIRRCVGALLCCVAVVATGGLDAFAQRPIEPVPLTPFGDGRDSVLMSELWYRIGDTNHVIVVPAGFVTDFASTPRAIWSVLPPTGRHQMAAIVHDFLYWDQRCTREEADALLRVAMAESLVSPFKRDIIWRAVRDFGEAAWTANARAKADGQPRIIPPSALPIPVLLTWPEYRTRLFSNGVRAEQSTPVAPPAYCGAAPLVKLQMPE